MQQLTCKPAPALAATAAASTQRHHSILAPLVRLHARCASCRLLGSSLPPSDSGTRWSSSASFSSFGC